MSSPFSTLDDDTDESDVELLSQHRPRANYRDGNPGTVPRFVFVAYYLVNTLQGFIFYTLWWGIVPYVQVTMKVTEDSATIAAQIYLLSDYLFSIAGGLLSDFKCTRYKLIFASSFIFFLTWTLQLILSMFMHSIPVPYRGYPFGVILFMAATSQGMTTGMLMPFGIEQLDDDSDQVIRSSLVRWSVWFYQIGCCLAYPFIVLEATIGNVSDILIVASSAFQITLFVILKRFYKLNKVSEGGRTVKHLKMALNRSLGRAETEEDPEWVLSNPAPEETPDHVKHYQRSLLRRCVLLVLIFFTFGPYMVDNFMSNIVFPIQARQVTNQTVTGPWFNVSYDVRASAVILLFIPLFDLIYRNSESIPRVLSNFVQVGLGMVAATLSIGTATLTHHFFPPKLTMKQPIDHTSANALLTIQYVLMGLSKSLFLTAGYDLAYVESPLFLKGTGIGLFRGLGSVFGALIFFIQYFCYPMGVNHETWPYAMVFAILTFTIFFMYTPLVNLYVKARTDSRRTRQMLEDEIQEFSTAYKTI